MVTVVTLHTAVADRDRVTIATRSSSIQSNITVVWTLWLVRRRYVVVICLSVCTIRILILWICTACGGDDVIQILNFDEDDEEPDDNKDEKDDDDKLAARNKDMNEST